MNVTINPQTVSVSIDPTTMGITVGNPITREYLTDRDPYVGDYVITPSSETQTLRTNNLRMTDNVIVNPIPSNYGRIDWNGQFLTVS